MSRFTVAVGAAALLSLLGTRPTGAQTTPTSHEIKSALVTMGPGGMFVVSAVELLSTAPPIEIEVSFFNERDRLVKQVAGEFGPGSPLVVSIKRGELRDPEAFTHVRAVVKLSRVTVFNQAAVRFELIDKGSSVGCGWGCTVCPRIPGQETACAMPGGSGPPQVNCPDGSVNTTI